MKDYILGLMFGNASIRGINFCMTHRPGGYPDVGVYLSPRELRAFITAYEQAREGCEDVDIADGLFEITSTPNEFDWSEHQEWVESAPDQDQAIRALLIESLVLQGGGQDPAQPWPGTTLAETLIRCKEEEG